MYAQINISLLWLAVIFSVTAIHADAQQLKLGRHPTQIQKSAVLELESPNQGLLLTRLSDTAAINTLSPPDGMIIYVNHKGVYERRNGAWCNLANTFKTSQDEADIKFSRKRDLVSLNIPDADKDTRGIISTDQQAFSGNKIFQNDLVSSGPFLAASSAIADYTLSLNKFSNPDPGYLLSTSTPGKVALKTNPDYWAVGGNKTNNPEQLGTTGGADLTFITDGKKRLRVASEGMVGIGPDAPETDLDVNGSFKLGKNGSRFERMAEGTAKIEDYLEQINVLNILQLGDKVGPYVFTLNVPGVKKNAMIFVNPANDWNDLNMSLKASLILVLNLSLDLGEAKVQIIWVRAPLDGIVEVGLLFDFNGVNFNGLSDILKKLFDNLSNPLLKLDYSSKPIEFNILFCNKED